MAGDGTGERWWWYCAVLLVLASVVEYAPPRVGVWGVWGALRGEGSAVRHVRRADAELRHAHTCYMCIVRCSGCTQGQERMSAGHEQTGGVEGIRERQVPLSHLPEVARPAVAAHHAAVAAPAPAPVTAPAGRGSFLMPLHRGGFPPQKRRHFLAGQIAGAGRRPGAIVTAAGGGCGCGGGEGLAAGRRRRADVADGLDRQP